MRKILSIMMTLVSIYTYAQSGLYQTIEQNGANAEYLEFYSVAKGEKEGTTYISGERYWVNASILKIESGEKIGFKLTKTDGSGTLTTQDEMGRYTRAKGYPNVSYLYHKDFNVYIAVGDYIMELKGISSDGLSFKSIRSVFVKKQVKQTSTNDKPKKKNKFLNALKDAALRNVSGSSSNDESKTLEAKKARSEDLHQIATDYLKAIKAKQNAYTLTAKDKADIAKLEALRIAEEAEIKRINAEYWASPEGQAIYGNKSSSSSSSSSYTIKNTTGNSVQVGHNGSSYLLYNGSTYEVSCDRPIYIKKLNGSTWKDTILISDGKNVCGKTITF